MPDILPPQATSYPTGGAIDPSNVFISTSPQSLTAAQKAQVHQNIGVSAGGGGGGSSDAGDLTSGILPAARLSRYNILAPNIYDHGTKTNGQTATLVTTHSVQKVLFSGATGTIAQSGTYLGAVQVIATFTNVGAVVLTVPSTINPAIDNDTADTTVNVIGSAAGAKVILNYGLESDGSLTLRSTSGDVVPPVTIQQGGTGSTTAEAALEALGGTRLAQNSQSAAYTLVLTDAGKHIFHPSADTTARIFTIPANASVAFPVGTVVTFINQNSGGVITIAITTDTMRLAGAGTTGSRTLAANGIANAVKVTSTEWLISGTGLT